MNDDTSGDTFLIRIYLQLCRLLRPRDSCAKCGCCASPGGVTHLREKKGSPRWAKIPASRKYEKTRARSSYRKRTSRYASRARYGSLRAPSATSHQAKLDPPLPRPLRRRSRETHAEQNFIGSRTKTSTEENMLRRNRLLVVQLNFDFGKLARHRRK